MNTIRKLKAFAVWPKTVEMIDAVVVAASNPSRARSALRAQAAFADVAFFDLRVRRWPCLDDKAGLLSTVEGTTLARNLRGEEG